MASRTTGTMIVGYAKNKELSITQNDAPLGLVNWDLHVCSDMSVRSHSGVPRDPHLERHKIVRATTSFHCCNGDCVAPAVKSGPIQMQRTQANIRPHAPRRSPKCHTVS